MLSSGPCPTCTLCVTCATSPRPIGVGWLLASRNSARHDFDERSPPPIRRRASCFLAFPSQKEATMVPTRREAIGLATAALTALALPGRGLAQSKLDAITVDYAYYNPVSLILKANGWLDRALAANGTTLTWVLSLGSNKANQFLASGSTQFASTAGSAALLARANGVPLHTVFLYSQPEWTAIVICKDSKLASLRDLKGKRIAATR